MTPSRLNKITLALLLGAGALPQAIAQQETDSQAANSGEQVEVIQVKGIRASAAANLNAKRFSNAIVDAITAEDIGKFPDKNVAESLQRVPGVTIQRQFGEGAAVSIRGAGPDFTLTTLNGQNVASTGWFVLEPAKRSFNYELLPSELVGDLEVYKSSQADLAEGGVGGTVVVNTRKPLDLDSLTAYASLEAQYQSDSEETDPQFSGLLSWKNEEENLGVLVSGVMQQRQLQRQGNEAFWEWGAGPVGFIQDRERSAITTTIQYAPSERLDFVLNYMDMKMEADNTNYALWLTQADTTWGSGVTEEWLGEGDYRTQVKGPLNVAYYQARPREATMNSDVLDLVMNYSGDSYKLKFQVGRTDSSGGTDFEMVVDDGTGGTPINNGTYDFTNGYQSWMFDGIGANNATYSTYDPGSLTMGTGPNFNRTPKTDEESYVQGDVEFDVDLGAIHAIKTGVKFTKHESTSLRYEYIQQAGFNPTISTSGLNAGLIDVGAGDYQIIQFDADALKAWAKASIVGENEDLGAHSEIEEDNFAAYVMAKFKSDNIRGNFGLRYAATDATSVFYVDGARQSTDADYAEWLPSFNLAMDLADDVILRFSAARTMARPQYIDMYVNPDVRGSNDDLPNNQFWIVGNVGLKPFVSNQFDLGLEWYFDESSLVSAAIFKKDVKNFVSFTEYNASAAEIPFPLPAAEAEFGWTVQEKSNGKDATIEGLELQFQQDFGNGFGTLVNYTYTDTQTDEDTFPADGNGILSDSSRHAYNLTGYYENDLFSVRLSYNWRDEYMLREVGAYGNRLHDDYGTLDLSAVYHLTDYLDLKLDVNNLTEESSKQFGNNNVPTRYSGFIDGFPLYEYEQARRITAGVSVKF
ncbi:TonB-dependent receptor [Aliiglaciecola sp. CAU 1673]|uniref:TonB-dependent receptor n=1 Tax=Aliiglaciecola sp. CAU 1673 TaxID=3032595 RepID=UPI0023DC1FE3|nr:TonB-dependent receptor [Aliiglaciecola sp. CAU 1673]MDF2179866.1 TonB-dependent receptor [Aliiglaciecola sp. CAU 1673]